MLKTIDLSLEQFSSFDGPTHKGAISWIISGQLHKPRMFMMTRLKQKRLDIDSICARALDETVPSIIVIVSLVSPSVRVKLCPAGLEENQYLATSITEHQYPANH